MFNAISWQGYWTAIALTAIIYYAIILLLYYRQDLQGWLQKKSTRREAVPATPFPTPDKGPHLQTSLFEAETDFQAPPIDTAEQTFYACMDELSAFFEAAKSRRWQRAQLLQTLKQVLSKYPALQNTEYKTSIVQIVQVQSEQYCSIHLKAEEVVGLW